MYHRTMHRIHLHKELIMFIHDNGKLNVLSNKKCGHVAMTYYFGMERPENRSFVDWISFPSPKVVVVRHPVERMHSAIRWNEIMFEERLKDYRETGEVDRFDLIEDIIHDHDGSMREEYVFYQHCRPYMKMFKNRDFRIIKFEDLGKYIPKITDYDTRTRNRNIDPFPENRYFSRQDLIQELEVYEEILQKKEVITPEEWKELT